MQSLARLLRSSTTGSKNTKFLITHKAVESLNTNWERLTAFFAFPTEHWKHLRTTNVIESAFTTVRLRARDPWRRITNQGVADGLQAARDGPAALAASGRRRPVALWCLRVRSLSTEFAPNRSARLLTHLTVNPGRAA
jgi:hypothetical protein